MASFEKVCFVISPIGVEGSPARIAADQLRQYIIQPVMEKFEYRVERADTIDTPGTITRQIIEYLVESPIVIADMTDLNPNVFYELAVRHAANRPVVHMIASDQRIPFDVAPERAIFYSLDLNGADQAKNRLERFVGAIASGEIESESPLTNALDRISLSRSSRSEDRRESQMMDILQDVQVRLINLQAEGAYLVADHLVDDQIVDVWTSLTHLQRVARDEPRQEVVASLRRLSGAFGLMIQDLVDKELLSTSAVSRLRHPSRSQAWRDSEMEPDEIQQSFFS